MYCIFFLWKYILYIIIFFVAIRFFFLFYYKDLLCLQRRNQTCVTNQIIFSLR